MLRSDNPVFKTFGEIYFSTVFKNIVKGWHHHKQSFLNYICMHGNIKLVLIDKREGSKTLDLTQEIILSPENYQLVTMPPNVWNGFKGLSEEESIIANYLSIPHNEDEMVRKDYNDNYFKYK
jgi:dTDP-4-dehydrorhamnose 3,5-epimerase